MPRFSSNDMVHNYYLEEDKEKTQERNRNSKSSVMHTVSPQNTTKGSKPKPRSTNQTSRSLPVSKSSCVTITVVPKADHSKDPSSFLDSKHFVCSICNMCIFNANHDACITKFLKEVNSRAKIQSNKTRNNNKPVDQKSHIQKPNRQIFTGHRFSFNKSSTLYEKTSPRSSLSKADSEPTHGSNVDISKIHECKQTLDLSAGTSINVQKEQSIDLSAADMIVMKSMIELESLFGPLFDEYFNGENQVVSMSSAVTTADASDKCQQQLDSTSSTSTLAKTVTADGNFDFDNYVFYDRVMYPLTDQQERKTRKDYGTKRARRSTSTSSSSALGQPSSSHHIDDDNDGNDEGTSRASTHSPTRFVNSLSNDIP
ncbi:hypothetical protein Tco_1090178 [Tanacetum coccineum]|uniref:Uncharacterized protein n=1 Tax=Tanacetum coccineum TaxID=301880 RepID=A0ABQ5I3I7_9ASTR